MNYKTTLLAAIAMAGLSGSAYAQSQAMASTDSETRILQAISITKNTDLRFGSIVKPATAGTNNVVIAAADGTRTLTGTGTAALANGTAVGRATYTVGGEGGQSFSITPDSTFNLNRTGGGGTISVTTSVVSATGALDGSIGSSGTASFGVGGQFAVADTTATGNYTGTFNVVVAYN